jgi:NAD(P)-dependent dehydrogenase (short-subunit alcohol dehydrogenase family)
MNRSVIITGAGSGIGAALAARLAARGDHLMLADVNDDSLARVAAELGPQAAARGGSVRTEVVDVRDAELVQALVDGVVSSVGRVDIMVNNAGIGLGGPAQDMPLSHWQRVLDVNLSGVMHGVVAVYPHMVAAGRGRIVNIASLAGLVPAPFLVAYSAAKHGVVGLSLSLAAEASGTGVAVTCVCPGFTDTPILDSQPPADLPPTVTWRSGRELAEAMPGRLYPVGELARDIESAIDRGDLLLVTPQSARITWWAARLLPRQLVRTAGRLAERGRRALLSGSGATQPSGSTILRTTAAGSGTSPR